MLQFNEIEIETLASALQALSNPLRFKMVCLLNGNECSVTELCCLVGSTQSNTSQHLNILRDSGILSARRDANLTYYRLRDQRMAALVEMVRKVYCQHR